MRALARCIIGNPEPGNHLVVYVKDRDFAYYLFRDAGLFAEQLREQWRKGNVKVGILMRALARCIIGNPGEAR